MGNYLQRGNRCWGCHTVKGCFCLPRKKISTSKARRDSPKENEGVTSVSIQQDNANQTYSQELCYILINHRALGRKSSGSSAEPRPLVDSFETQFSCLQ
ncbi:germinal center-associated signaling and motility protein isoform X3 [Castor canadensis]|uniref:Germinal center-associated signaling and motility protein isoform X3 n=1 Tax=Castor canadensis TaxID=51338 RepID=A0AC58MIG6_CASCN